MRRFRLISLLVLLLWVVSNDLKFKLNLKYLHSALHVLVLPRLVGIARYRRTAGSMYIELYSTSSSSKIVLRRVYTMV